MALLLLMNTMVFAQANDAEVEPVVTHADAAVMLAKFSGQFERYISRDADLSECVAFFNKAGIYFGFLEIATGAEFTSADCARVTGQAELVFAGNAEFSAGKVSLPQGMASWPQYCILNDIKYLDVHKSMKELLRAASQKNM